MIKIILMIIIIIMIIIVIIRATTTIYIYIPGWGAVWLCVQCSTRDREVRS